MTDTLHLEQLTNPDFRQWEQEIVTDLGKTLLYATSVRQESGDSTDHFAATCTFGDADKIGAIIKSHASSGNTGNIKDDEIFGTGSMANEGN